MIYGGERERSSGVDARPVDVDTSLVCQRRGDFGEEFVPKNLAGLLTHILSSLLLSYPSYLISIVALLMEFDDIFTDASAFHDYFGNNVDFDDDCSSSSTAEVAVNNTSSTPIVE